MNQLPRLKYLAFWLLAAVAVAASAQTYPNRPIKIIQGFNPGGGTDVVARLLGGEMSKTLGQPMVVEAKPGAGSTLAANAVAKSPPNGYNLYAAMSSHAVAGALFKSLPYNPVDDFEMISTVYEFPMLIVVRSNSPVQNLRALLDLARAKPESVAYGSAGIGAVTHLIGELLSKTADVKLLHVPYKGEVACVNAILGNEIPMAIVSPSGALAQVKAGTLKVVAVTSNTRWQMMPDVPTVEEAGNPNFDVRSWFGLAAPAGTPKPIIEQLNQEVQRALQVPEVRARLEAMGGEVRGSTPQEMRTRVVNDLQRWKRVVSEANIPQQ